MHSISDLTTFCRKTTGDVPAKLVVCACMCVMSTQDHRGFFAGRLDHRRGLKNVSLRMFSLVSPATCRCNSTRGLQGGRLVTERRMVADLYVFDLEAFLWQKIIPNSDDDVPKARYFHSADACEPTASSYTVSPSPVHLTIAQGTITSSSSVV